MCTLQGTWVFLLNFLSDDLISCSANGWLFGMMMLSFLKGKANWWCLLLSSAVLVMIFKNLLSSMDISTFSFDYCLGKSWLYCWVKSSSRLTTKMWLTVTLELLPIPQLFSFINPLITHPKTALTAYGPSSWLLITCQGSISLDALVPITNPIPMSIWGSLTSFR